MSENVYRPMRIFIATPGDLTHERAALLDVVSEVNTIKAHHSGFHIEVLGWEQTLPGRGRPQLLINEEIKRCDLFIMSLWERWGTPSGEYSSGTEEEFHVAKGLNAEFNRPEIWLFFKEAVNNQDKHIIAFKEERESLHDFYYHTFKSTIEWTNLLRKFLCKWLDNLDKKTLNTQRPIEKPSDNKSNDILYRITYLDWIGTYFKEEPIIYFTIEDEVSFEIWTNLSGHEKQQYIYNRLSENLGLTLGANPYLAQMRYKKSDSQYLLLATIVRKYEDSLESSRIFIPDNYSHLCKKSEAEVSFDGYV